MSDPRLDWSKLLCNTRLPSSRNAPDDAPDWFVPSRNAGERDLDRILYAASTRRLGDKTQVFPLDRTDTVRNRLTHSHEVSNLARSIGVHLVHSDLFAKMMADASSLQTDDGKRFAMRAVPAILAAAGLAHDMGNPPFGHQGEAAIRSWFKRNDKLLLGEKANPAEVKSDIERLDDQHKADFLSFEGNAQTIRALTRLQVVKDDRGLNLTFATIATLQEYTVGSNGRGDPETGPVATRKFGYYASEEAFVARVRQLGTARRRSDRVRLRGGRDGSRRHRDRAQ